MEQVFKTFEIVADQTQPEQLRHLARSQVDLWKNELALEGYIISETNISLEVTPGHDTKDPRFVSLTVGLWVEKVELPS